MTDCVELATKLKAVVYAEGVTTKDAIAVLECVKVELILKGLRQ